MAYFYAKPNQKGVESRMLIDLKNDVEQYLRHYIGDYDDLFNHFFFPQLKKSTKITQVINILIEVYDVLIKIKPLHFKVMTTTSR